LELSKFVAHKAESGLIRDSAAAAAIISLDLAVAA
jgi:hypothetical protein